MIKEEDDMALTHGAYHEVDDANLMGTLWTFKQWLVYHVQTPTSAINPLTSNGNLWEIFILLKSRKFLTDHTQIWLAEGG